MARRPGRNRPSSIRNKDPPGIPLPRLSAGMDPDACPGNGEGQDTRPGRGESPLDIAAGAGLDQEKNATTAPRAANLARERAFLPGQSHEAADLRGRDAGEI